MSNKENDPEQEHQQDQEQQQLQNQDQNKKKGNLINFFLNLAVGALLIGTGIFLFKSRVLNAAGNGSFYVGIILIILGLFFVVYPNILKVK